MNKEIWINLPVKDLRRSKAFFAALGFSFKEEPETPTMLAMEAGAKNVPIMLFEESVFQNIVQHKVTDTRKSSEVLFSFDAENREEVDKMAEKVKQAGGTVFSEPAEVQGWMYGCAFSDPDGHRWNILYRDLQKARQS